MKASHLKALVTEIVKVYTEMSQQGDTTSWSVSGDTLTIENFQLPDGRLIGAEVEIDGNWDNGAFTHAFGVHKYPAQYNVEKWQIKNVWDMNGTQPLAPDNAIRSALDAYVDSISDEVGQQVEPSEPDAGEDYREREQDLDR